MLKFFEVFQRVTYIFDHMMNAELHSQFLQKCKEVIKSKSLPVQDTARMLDILTKTTAFSAGDLLETQVLNEVTSKLRQNSFAIPKSDFPQVLSNLIELQNP
jgi:hypothetical protein